MPHSQQLQETLGNQEQSNAKTRAFFLREYFAGQARQILKRGSECAHTVDWGM